MKFKTIYFRLQTTSIRDIRKAHHGEWSQYYYFLMPLIFVSVK